METLTLNNGILMPALGLGVFQTPPDETRDAVHAALDAGYRHIDTAAATATSARSARPSRLRRARDEVFLETKIWISDYGYDETLHGFDKSAAKLGVDQIDLLILHQALPSAFDRTLELTGRSRPCSGTARSAPSASATSWSTTSPSCWRERPSCRRSTRSRCTRTSSNARSGVRRGARHRHPGLVAHRWHHLLPRQQPHQHPGGPGIGAIAEAHSKSPAQVMLRWHLQQGRSVIPKSTKPHRIAENFDVFDFELTAAELADIDALDTERRGGPQPPTSRWRTSAARSPRPDLGVRTDRTIGILVLDDRRPGRAGKGSDRLDQSGCGSLGCRGLGGAALDAGSGRHGPRRGDRQLRGDGRQRHTPP